MPINAIISLRILALIHGGMTVTEATDAVLGQGTFKKIADEIYEALRAKT